jgi:hypothetical protein
MNLYSNLAFFHLAHDDKFQPKGTTSHILSNMFQAPDNVKIFHIGRVSEKNLKSRLPIHAQKDLLLQMPRKLLNSSKGNFPSSQLIEKGKTDRARSDRAFGKRIQR